MIWNGHKVELKGNSGCTLEGVAVTLNVTDSSKKAAGKFCPQRRGYMFVAGATNDDTIVGNGFIEANGKGIINNGTATN